MKKRLQGLIAGLLIGSIVTGGVLASTGSNIVEIFFDNIKVYKDNELCELKDANGNSIEPFIYNNTTYLPVRATASLADMQVNWDGDTKSVYLWDEQSQGQNYLIEECGLLETNGTCKEYYASNGESFLMSGKKYTNGIVMESYNSSAAYAIDTSNWIVECVVGHAGYENLSKSVSFFINGLQVKEVKLWPGDAPVKVRFPVSDADYLDIVVNGTGHIGIANITVE